MGEREEIRATERHRLYGAAFAAAEAAVSTAYREWDADPQAVFSEFYEGPVPVDAMIWRGVCAYARGKQAAARVYGPYAEGYLAAWTAQFAQEGIKRRAVA